MNEAGVDTTAHVLVIDDDTRIRDLLRRYLTQNGFLVTGAASAAHARRILAGLSFDLLIVDVMMPGEDGLSFTRAIRSDIDTPILMLTARSDAGDRIAGLESGVDDYLAKPFEPRELLLRANAILRRATPVAELPRAMMLGAVRYDMARGELWRGRDPVRLTGTESALMRVLARVPNVAVSRIDLVEALGGAERGAQERAVDVQITRLRRKIEDDPRSPRYLQTVRGEGYMLTPD